MKSLIPWPPSCLFSPAWSMFRSSIPWFALSFHASLVNSILSFVRSFHDFARFCDVDFEGQTRGRGVARRRCPSDEPAAGSLRGLPRRRAGLPGDGADQCAYRRTSIQRARLKPYCAPRRVLPVSLAVSIGLGLGDARRKRPTLAKGVGRKASPDQATGMAKRKGNQCAATDCIVCRSPVYCSLSCSPLLLLLLFFSSTSCSTSILIKREKNYKSFL